MTQANPRRGAFAVALDGREFVFVATLGNVARLEAALGVGLTDLMERLGQNRAGDMIEVAVALCGDASLRECLVGDLPKITEAVFRALTFGADAGNAAAAPA